jgi:hypothetical protein
MRISSPDVMSAYLPAAICVALVTGCGIDNATSPRVLQRTIRKSTATEEQATFTTRSNADLFTTSASALGTVDVSPEGYNVSVSASGTTYLQRDHEIPNDYPRSCSGTDHCGWTWFEQVDCYSSDWDVQSVNDGTGRFPSGRVLNGHAQSQRHCSPDSNGGSGDPYYSTTSGSGKDCSYYIIQISNDGGASWTTIGSWQECY